MNIHEYQAKELFRQYGMPVSKGVVVDNLEEARSACARIGGERWVAKVQAQAGGRGKAGGVKLVSSQDEAAAFTAEWIGKRIRTFQTGEDGQPVSRVLIEACTDIDKELYLSALVDRTSRRLIVMASTEGGVDIEEVAAKTPEKIFRQSIDPLLGPMPWQARAMAKELGLNALQTRQFVTIFRAIATMFVEKDLDLLEINPLVITEEGNLHCLDGKVSVDDNALYRQKELLEMRDRSQEDEREADAAEHELNYVALDGTIGCMVNGAGLAMATMDLIQFYGGAPANFLDVGGRTTADRVAEAFKIVLSEEKVRTVLVNIFGGIVRCDFIAEGIVKAVKEVGVSVPVVVRLEGNNATLGLRLIADSGTQVIAAESLEDAAKKAIEAAK